MEQHGHELDDDDGKEEEHENNSNGFKVQVLFGDDDLGKMNSLMKMIKNEATNKQPPLLYKRYVTLPLFLSPDRDEELAKMTEGRVTTFVSFKLCNFYLLYPHPFNGIYSHMMLFLIYYAPNLIQKLRLDMQVMKTEIIVWHQIL